MGHNFTSFGDWAHCKQFALIAFRGLVICSMACPHALGF